MTVVTAIISVLTATMHFIASIQLRAAPHGPSLLTGIVLTLFSTMIGHVTQVLTLAKMTTDNVNVGPK